MNWEIDVTNKIQNDITTIIIPTIMTSVTKSLLGVYLKQISHVCDQVADFVNSYGFKETADSLEKSNKSTTVELSCDVTQELTETFNEYGYVTLGITWLPGEYYLLI